MPRMLSLVCLWAVFLLGFRCPEALGKPNVIDLSEEDSKARSKPMHFKVDWRKDADELKVVGEKVSAQDDVSILVAPGFNFFRYAITLTVKEEEVPLYTDLEKLWTGFLAPPLGGAFTAQGVNDSTGFVVLLKAWDAKLTATESALSVFQAALTNDCLLDSEQQKMVAAAQAALKLQGAALKKQRKDLSDALRALPVLQDQYYAQALYEAVLKRHLEVMDKLSTFARVASEVTAGKLFAVGQKPAGTRVTVTLKVSAIEKDQKEAADNAGDVTVQYLVSSDLPVVFHAGPVFTHLTDIEVAQVRSLDRGDLFREIKSPSNGANLVAYLGYEVAVNAKGKPGLLLSIGTDVASPGDRLFLGASFNLGRFLLDLGASTAVVAEGENLVTENLYETFRKERKWGSFIGFSLNPF